MAFILHRFKKVHANNDLQQQSTGTSMDCNCILHHTQCNDIWASNVMRRKTKSLLSWCKRMNGFHFYIDLKMIMKIVIHNHALIMYDYSEIMQIIMSFHRIKQLGMLKQESCWAFITLNNNYIEIWSSLPDMALMKRKIDSLDLWLLSYQSMCVKV